MYDSYSQLHNTWINVFKCNDELYNESSLNSYASEFVYV